MSDSPILDEEKLSEFFEEALVALKDKDNIDKFIEAFRYIRTTAVYIDEAFDKINRTLLKFVDDHGLSFPEMAGSQTKWTGFKRVRSLFYLSCYGFEISSLVLGRSAAKFARLGLCNQWRLQAYVHQLFSSCSSFISTGHRL